MYLQLLLLHSFLCHLRFLRHLFLRFHSPQQILGKRRVVQHSTKGHPENMKGSNEVVKYCKVVKEDMTVFKMKDENYQRWSLVRSKER